MLGMTLYGKRFAPVSLFDDLFGESWPFPIWGDEKPASWAPKMDVYEKDSELHIEADLPGMEKDAIKVEFDDGVLTISGERKEEKEENGGTWYSKERSYGAFTRSFRLGDSYDPKKIDAKFSNGVLHVTVGRKEETKPITVKVN